MLAARAAGAHGDSSTASEMLLLMIDTSVPAPERDVRQRRVQSASQSINLRARLEKSGLLLFSFRSVRVRPCALLIRSLPFLRNKLVGHQS